MIISYRDVLTFTPLLISAGMAVAGSTFKATHPATPNFDFGAVGGLFGAISFLIGLHIVFLERRRPARYTKAWHRFGAAVILWFGGCGAIAWNLATAR